LSDGVVTGRFEQLASLVDRLSAENAQLEEALRSRIVIEQAKGILAERYRIGVEEAFNVLRAAARAHRVKIHDLASQVIDGPRTPRAIELQLVQGGRVRERLPSPASDAAH